MIQRSTLFITEPLQRSDEIIQHQEPLQSGVFVESYQQARQLDRLTNNSAATTTVVDTTTLQA